MSRIETMPAPTSSQPNAVLLITGPGGSGKSTLARYTARRLGWACVSEDEYWVRTGWGSGLRTAAQEREIQGQVMRDVRAEAEAGRGVVLEFILYALPPNPLTNYRAALSSAGFTHAAVALMPTVDEVLARMARRGRPNDLRNLSSRRADAEHQLSVLEASSLEPGSIVDPTGMTVDALYRVCRVRLSAAGVRL
jgi:adenylate kinase family enzyme